MSIYGEHSNDVPVQIHQIDCKYYQGPNNKIVFYFVIPPESKILDATAFKIGRMANENTTTTFHIHNDPSRPNHATRVVKRIQTNVLSDINLEIERGGLILCELGIDEIDHLVLHYKIL